MAEPTGLIASSGIELLTAPTPNGHKVTVLLEELKEAYGTEYTVRIVDIFVKNTQKQPWFVALNPNGKAPVIVDHNRGGFVVFETMAILNYLARQYDPEQKVSFAIGSDDYSVGEQWLAWQHGGITTMQSQANFFLRFSKERDPYAIQRYVGETERLYGVLDARLADRDYIAGPGRGKYSIADIYIVPMANATRFGGIDLRARFPHVQAWFDRVWARPAVQRGVAALGPFRFANAALEKALAEGGEEDLKKTVEEGDRWVQEAKEQYGYKYTSP